MQTDPETRVPYGNFCGVYVHEHWADGQTHYAPFGEHAHDPKPPQWRLDTLITPADSRLREIERSDKWPNSSDVARNHRLCRRWRGDNCANVLDASTSTEWHATIAYVPEQLLGAGGLAQNVSPLRLGDDVTLTLTAMFAPAGSTCEATTRRHTFQETVSVHLGENELPRFDSGWVYGDLHYHSQGTDNDGESGYAYRPTLQAMRAMGLDFAFATEHASASGQVTDLDPLFIDNFPDTFAPDFLERRAQNLLNTLLAGATVFQSVNAARDMNATRFAYLHQWLDRPASDPNPGANAEAMRALPGGRRAPRLFLGGEVDVIPEISAAEASSGKLEYGNGKSYRWGESCWMLPPEFLTAGKYTSLDACPRGPMIDLLDPVSDEMGLLDPSRYAVKDIQGLLDNSYYARQHIVYLPKDGTLPKKDTPELGFVPSDTETYGGATVRLRDVLSPAYPYAMAGKGYGFLAHPMTHASGNGNGRLGPDIIPYSDVQLKTAFDSPAILGLQLWNEDTRGKSVAQRGYGTDAPAYRDAHESSYWDLHNGATTWDKMLQWGLRPSQTTSLSWIPTGMPRRVYMAGGSDAHGDWNYRREGSIGGTEYLTDSALGKPRNLVNIGLSRPDSVVTSDGTSAPTFTQTQVTTALAAGAFSVTDGPAVRLAIDTNNNGVIDGSDVPMGGIGYLGTGVVRVVVEWISTSEFQPVAGLDVYVGAANSATDKSVVYAPTNHGARPNDRTGSLDPYVYKSGTTGYRKLQDGYMADRTGILHIVPASADYVNGNPYHGRRTLLIRASDYVVGTAKDNITYGEDVCTSTWQCNKPGFGAGCEKECTRSETHSYEYQNAQTPNRMYIRAFARTQVRAVCAGTSKTALNFQAAGKCSERLAYTNPVWIVSPPVINIGTGGGGLSVGGP
jgi:hypothetical protein